MGTFSNPFEVFFALSVETFRTHELPSLFTCKEWADASHPAHSPPFQTFWTAKYSVPCWCPMSSKNGPKSSLRSANALRYSQHKNNFGFLLNRQPSF